jgi:hypothetical protein
VVYDFSVLPSQWYNCKTDVWHNRRIDKPPLWYNVKYCRGARSTGIQKLLAGSSSGIIYRLQLQKFSRS